MPSTVHNTSKKHTAGSLKHPHKPCRDAPHSLAQENTVRKCGPGLGQLVLVRPLFLPKVDDLRRPIEEDNTVPARMICEPRASVSVPTLKSTKFDLSGIQSLASKTVLSSSQASTRGQKKYSVTGLRWPCGVQQCVDRKSLLRAKQEWSNLFGPWRRPGQPQLRYSSPATGSSVQSCQLGWGLLPGAPAHCVRGSTVKEPHKDTYRGRETSYRLRL